MSRLPTQPNLSPTTLFNPDREAFIFSYDAGRESYTLHAMSYGDFPKYIADLIAPLLADRIIGKLGVKENHELDKKNLLEKIYVK